MRIMSGTESPTYKSTGRASDTETYSKDVSICSSFRLHRRDFDCSGFVALDIPGCSALGSAAPAREGYWVRKAICPG